MLAAGAGQLGQEEMATMLGEGVERTLVPLVRRFDAQLGLVSDSQDALLKRLDTVTDGSCSRGMRTGPCKEGAQRERARGVAV